MRDLTNSSAFRIKLIAFSGFKKTQKFFLKNQSFFSRRKQFLNVLRSHTISIASYNKFLAMAISTKSIFFLEKPINFIYYNQILKVSRSHTFSVAFYRKFATFSIFFLEKSNFSFQKIHHIVPSKNLKFEPSETFHFLNAIVEQICYF